MSEIYSVESGEGVITISGRQHALTSGICIVVEPGEEHEVSNISKEDLIITMVGIKA